jgi:hypothetical protein
MMSIVISTAITASFDLIPTFLFIFAVFRVGLRSGDSIDNSRKSGLSCESGCFGGERSERRATTAEDN